VSIQRLIEVANTFTTLVESTGATYSSSDIPGVQSLLAAVDESDQSVTDGPTMQGDSDTPAGYQVEERGACEWDEAAGMLTIVSITSGSNGDWG